MFVFDNVSEKDVISYQYELYESSQVTGSYPSFSLIASPIIYSTGTSGASVFTIAVANSTDVENIKYYGRVRTIDTSGNTSSWSPLVETDKDTPLIGDQYLASITAAKITAGTIGAHEIILSQAGPQANFVAPANMAVLRSSDYDGTYDANTTVWTTATNGWIIAGDGYAEFSSASIRGGLKAESVYINADNRWRRNNTDTAVSNEFKVGSSAKYLYFDGTNLSFTGEINATTFTGGSINIGNGTFQVNSSGNLTATSANISGTVTATAGQIASFEISGDDLLTGGSYPGSLRIGPSIWNSQAAVEIEGTILGSSVYSAGYYLLYNSTTGDSLLGAIDENLLGVKYPRIELSGDSGVTNLTDFAITTPFMMVDEISSYGWPGAPNSGGVTFSDPIYLSQMHGYQENVIYVMDVDGFSYQGVNYGPGAANGIGFLWDSPNLYGVVDNAASMVIGTTSDIRSKSEIVNANENWINKILSEVRVVEFIPVNPFEWDEKEKNSEKKPKRLGIIAQELKEIIPHLVVGGKNPEDLLSVDYTGLIPHIIQSIQSIDKRLKEIEKS